MTTICSAAPLVWTTSLVVHFRAVPLLLLGLLLHHVNNLVRDPQVLDGAAANVAFRHPPEPVAVFGCTNHLPEVDIHPGVAANQVAIVRFAILQLHQLNKKAPAELARVRT